MLVVDENKRNSKPRVVVVICHVGNRLDIEHANLKLRDVSQVQIVLFLITSH